MYPGFAFFRKGLLLLPWLSLLLPQPGITQHHVVLYPMFQVPQSNLLNPGAMPLVRAYVGLPVLNSVRTGLLSSSLTIDQLAGKGGGVLTDIDYAGLLGRQGARNSLGLEADVELFGLGLRLGKGFLYFNAGDHFLGNFRYPDQLIRMFRDVQLAGEQGPPNAGSVYDLSQLAFRLTQYRSYGLGYAYSLFDNLSIGGRFRYLLGNADLWTVNRNLMMINTGQDIFRISGRLEILSAGLDDLSTFAPGNFLWPDGGNRGYAVDFGAVYRLNEQWEFSASALNLGAIRWKRHIQTQIVAENLFEFSTRDLEAFEDEVGDIFDALQESETVDGRGFYQTPLPRRLYLGATYYYRPRTYFAALLHPVISDGRMDFGLAVSANTRFRKWIGLSAAYSAVGNHFFNLGLGLNLDLGPVQFYAVTDNLPAVFSYRTARNANAQLGINLVFGRMVREDLLQEEEPIAEADLAVPAEDSLDKKAERAQRRQERAELAAAKKKAREVTAAETIDKKAQRRQERAELAAAKKKAREVAAASPTPVLPDTVANPASDSAIKPSAFFTFTLTAKDQASGERLKGLSLEISRVVGSSRELLFTGSAYSGVFSMPLEREVAHIIIVRKLGYLPDEFLLESGDAGAQTELRHEFILVEGPAPAASRHQPGFPPSAGPTAQAPAKPASSTPNKPVEPTGEETASIADSPTPPQPALGTFEITDPTSLREGPHHTHPVILRFSTGDRVEVLEKTDAYWWKVRFRGRVGYVKAALLQ